MSGREQLSGALLQATLFEEAATAFVLLDAEGAVLTMNASAETLLGGTRRSLKGEKAADIFEEAACTIEHLACRQAASPVRFAAVVEREEGESVSVLVVLSRLEGEAARSGAFLMEVTEVEDLLRLQRERAEAEVRRGNAELLRNLAHEVKNPLGGIRGAAQLLHGDLTRPDDRECTGLIMEEADRLTRLVDRLLLPYRAPLEVEPLNIHKILEHVAGILGHEFADKVEIVRDYDISVPDVAGDRGRMTQVFLNLVRNALEALEGTEKPVIRLKTRLLRDVFLRGVRVRRVLRVDVVDNGPGIPESIRDRIFFPLVTGRPEGSGIGLSIVKTFVEASGGAVEVTSRPGRTVFSVTLRFFEPKHDVPGTGAAP